MFRIFERRQYETRKNFPLVYILAVFIGPYMTVSAVWTIADIFNGLMAIPNMIAIFALNSIVVKETRDFFKRHKEGKIKKKKARNRYYIVSVSGFFNCQIFLRTNTYQAQH